jgi:hypothetical protein
MKKNNKKLIAAVIQDLENGLSYVLIAVKNSVGVDFVCQTAKRAGLARRSQPQVVITDPTDEQRGELNIEPAEEALWQVRGDNNG